MSKKDAKVLISGSPMFDELNDIFITIRHFDTNILFVNHTQRKVLFFNGYSATDRNLMNQFFAKFNYEYKATIHKGELKLQQRVCYFDIDILTQDDFPHCKEFERRIDEEEISFNAFMEQKVVLWVDWDFNELITCNKCGSSFSVNYFNHHRWIYPQHNYCETCCTCERCGIRVFNPIKDLSVIDSVEGLIEVCAECEADTVD